MLQALATLSIYTEHYKAVTYMKQAHSLIVVRGRKS